MAAFKRRPNAETPRDAGPPQPATLAPRPWQQLPRRRMTLALMVAMVVVLAAAGITGYLVWPHRTQMPSAHPGPASAATAQPEAPRVQIVLPFTGLDGPDGVAVDTAGNLYVTAGGNDRVVMLSVDSSIQSELPFTGLHLPIGVAVDSAGNLYVTDRGRQVIKLAAGSSTQMVVPFTGLSSPWGVAVDSAGGVTVTDNGNQRVLKLPPG